PADQIVAHIDEYDFAILRTLLITDTERYCMLPLYDDYLCAVVYSSHPLAGRKSIRLEELKDEVFVFPQKGSGLCMIPLEGAPHYPISLIYPKSVTLTEAQRTFLRFLRMWKKSTSVTEERRGE